MSINSNCLYFTNFTSKKVNFKYKNISNIRNNQALYTLLIKIDTFSTRIKRLLIALFIYAHHFFNIAQFKTTSSPLLYLDIDFNLLKYDEH